MSKKVHITNKINANVVLSKNLDIYLLDLPFCFMKCILGITDTTI